MFNVKENKVRNKGAQYLADVLQANTVRQVLRSFI